MAPLLSKDTTKLLQRLRSLMQDKSLIKLDQQLDAYLIPSSDAHSSEYLANRDKRRQFISNFTGSSGTALVTHSDALLWTDGRYFLQASQELDSNWTLMKDGLAETPSIGDWLASKLPTGSKVGVDARLYEEDLFQQLAVRLNKSQIDLLHVDENLIDLVWRENGCDEADSKELKKLIVLDKNHTGLSTKEKLKVVRDKLESTNTDLTVLTSLDEIAWLLNLRGQDIPFGAVFFAYMIVPKSQPARVYTNLSRVDQEIRGYLEQQEENVQVLDYVDFYQDYKKLITSGPYANKRIYLSSTSNHLVHSLVPNSSLIFKDLSIVAKLKMIKNAKEIELARAIHLRDSVILCEYFYKLDKQFCDLEKKNHFESVQETTEHELAEYLDQMRLEAAGSLGPSFETICGYGSNGAIIHYKPDKQKSKLVDGKDSNSLFLVDSGGHYLDLGTTDVTRTVYLGDKTTISEYIKECFTLVLRGHIQLALKTIPVATRSETLDSFARFNLWQVGLNYGHGTGHGVGALLNVHELPIMSFRRTIDTGGIQENMILTIEPGYYEDGKFGIRIENCYRTCLAETKYGKPGSWLNFDSLTLVPIQLELIDKSLLTQEEIKWLNDYHERVFREVGQELHKIDKMDVYEWLKEQTKAI